MEGKGKEGKGKEDPPKIPQPKKPVKTGKDDAARLLAKTCKNPGGMMGHPLKIEEYCSRWVAAGKAQEVEELAYKGKFKNKMPHEADRMFFDINGNPALDEEERKKQEDEMYRAAFETGKKMRENEEKGLPTMHGIGPKPLRESIKEVFGKTLKPEEDGK
jgi:hypothetical protein